MTEKSENELIRCRKCRKPLYGKNAQDVGYCLDCFAIMMSDDDEEEIDEEYNQQQNP